MPQTGAARSPRSRRGEPVPPPAVVAFDPVGEIRVEDHRAAIRAAAAEEFAARFGLDHGTAPVEITGPRTIVIAGRGAERALPRRARDGRRPGGPRREPTGPRPDRVALCAVALGLLLILIAVASAHGTVL